MNQSSEYRFLAKPLFFATVVMLLSFAIPAPRVQAQQPTPQTDAAPGGNVENGKQNFKKFGCFSCHGYSGQGGAGARLAQNPITFQAFMRYVRKPARSMPPFGNQISDSELADIYAYIKSVPPSPAPKSIPLLNE